MMGRRNGRSAHRSAGSSVFRSPQGLLPWRAWSTLCAISLAVALSGCHAPTPVERAEALVRRNEPSKAIAVLSSHLREHPEDIPARRLLVRAHAWSGDLGAARREVAELERRLPQDPVPRIELGHAFELTHRFEEALAAYDEAANVAPASPLGPREGGLRAARWGEVEDARPRLEEAARRGANDAEFWHALGLVRLHERDFDGAREAYERGLRVDPARMDNLLGVASVAVVRGDAGAALAAYDRLLARMPAYAPAELGRAWALGELGRTDEALRALDHASSLGAPRVHVEKQRSKLKAK